MKWVQVSEMSIYKSTAWKIFVKNTTPRLIIKMWPAIEDSDVLGVGSGRVGGVLN